MKRKIPLFTLCLAACSLQALAAGNANSGNDNQQEKNEVKESRKSRLTLGGYGEAVYSRNFYSDKYMRYITPENYKDESHGRFDLPHVVLFIGYDFGKGWTMGSEIEFEHGGTESAVEIEQEEAGE